MSIVEEANAEAIKVTLKTALRLGMKPKNFQHAKGWQVGKIAGPGRDCTGTLRPVRKIDFPYKMCV